MDVAVPIDKEGEKSRRTNKEEEKGHGAKGEGQQEVKEGKEGKQFFKKLESQEQSEFKKKTRGRMKKKLGED